MNADINPGNLKVVWQSQALEGATMSLEQVRNRILKLEKTIRNRTRVGGSACIIILLAFAYAFAISTNVVQRIGAALCVLGGCYFIYQLILGMIRTHVAFRLGNESETSVAFYRSELQRQRDFHRGLWLWSRLLVITPGPLIFCLGMALSSSAAAKTATLIASVLVLELIVAVPLNLRLAREYQHELESLDSGAA